MLLLDDLFGFRAIQHDLLHYLLHRCESFNRGFTAGKLSGIFNMGDEERPIFLNSENILNYLVDMQPILDEATPFGFYSRNDHIESSGTYFCILHPWMKEILPLKLIKMVNNFTFLIENLNIIFYISADLPLTLNRNTISFFSTRSAIEFKSQIKEGVLNCTYKLIHPEWLGELCCQRYGG